MISYITRRLLQIIPTLLVLLTIMFFLLNILPGDAALLAGASRKGQSEEMMKNIREKWGLDDPIHVRYFKYLFNLLRGDLGTSYRTHSSVAGLIGNKLVATLTLVGVAGLGSTIIGVLLGFVAGIRHGSFLDLFTTGGAIMGISAPRFWVGLMLMYFFAVILGVLPASGFGGGRAVFYVLPSITLGIPLIALLARTTRASVLDVVSEDYVRTARSKGLSEKLVQAKHIFSNAFLPVITVSGLQLGTMLANTVVVEKVFSWPGLGNLIVTSILRRDIPAVQGCILIFAIAFIALNLLVDVLYAYLDPRIRYT